DDLTVTNIKRIKRAADEGACNALLLKVLPGTHATILQGRSGETEDNYIADLAVGLRTGQIKT
ncbi:unnamed protein product, partial [Ectocarpus fasciculatus]